MKEIIEHDTTKMDNGIEVKAYLTYNQIEAIANQVCRFDTWAEREATIDIMLLHYATNLTDEEIESIGHEMFIQSGVMDQVKNNIRNYNKIEKCINYIQSVPRALSQILKELPDMLEPIKEISKKYGSEK